MAKNAPAFQLYAQDLLTGTAELSDQVFGIYVRLLCSHWVKGSIPSDINKISRLVEADKAELAGLWSEIEDNFTELEGSADRLVNERLYKQSVKHKALQITKSKAGKLGAEVKKAKGKAAKSQHVLEQMESKQQAGATAKPQANTKPFILHSSYFRDTKEKYIKENFKPYAGVKKICDQVNIVFAYYVVKHNKSDSYLLSKKRSDLLTKIIKPRVAALIAGGMTELDASYQIHLECCGAIDGNLRNPWNNGTAPNSSGKPFHDFELIFRDDQKFDGFVADATTNFGAPNAANTKLSRLDQEFAKRDLQELELVDDTQDSSSVVSFQ